MVARDGGYYGAQYKCFRRVTQRDPLSPTITNMFVDAVLHHWVNVVAASEEASSPRAASMEGFRRDVQSLAAYFYADDKLITSMRATHIQRNFDTLTELFEHVGIRTNVSKTASMACKPYRALGGHSTEAYGLRITERGGSFRYRLLQRVLCPDCDVDLAACSLEYHRQVQHGVDWGDLKDPPLNPTSVQGRDVSDIVPTGGTRHRMTGGRLSREGEYQRTPGTFHSPRNAGHCIYPGGGYQPPPVLPQV